MNDVIYPPEIVEYCINLNNVKKSFAYKYKIEKDGLTDSIVNITYFLDNTVSISERVYCILHSIYNIPLCACGKKVKFDQYSTGYRKFCSVKCSSNSVEKKEKIKKTNLEKYGCVNAFQSEASKIAWDEYIADKGRMDSMKSKIGETLKNNLGVSTIEEAHKIRTEKALKIKIEKYGCNYNNRKKANLTRDEKKIQEKMQETSLRKYGVPYPMQTSEVFDTCMKKSYSKKDYVFPSGKVVQIQGFENLALDELLHTYDESDILVGSKNMPKIWYEYAGVKRRYYPDIFIPRDNTIIEVKSDYTMKASEDVNNLKAEATKKAGYIFEFYVYGNDKKRIK